MSFEKGLQQADVNACQEQQDSKKELLQGVSVEVVDSRNPTADINFNIDSFVEDFLSRLACARNPKRFYREQKWVSNKYGKLFQFATAESDDMVEIARDVTDIRIEVTNLQRKMVNGVVRKTIVNIYFLLSNDRHASMTLIFDEDGRYASSAPSIIKDNNQESVQEGNMLDSANKQIVKE